MQMKSDIHGSSVTGSVYIYTRCTPEGMCHFQDLKITITLPPFPGQDQWMAARAVGTIEVMSSVIVLGIWGFIGTCREQSTVKIN